MARTVSSKKCQWVALGALALASVAGRPLFAQSSPALSPPSGGQTNAAARQTTPPKRRLEEDELCLLLNAALQRQLGTEGGRWELSFTRPWTAVKVPDVPLTIEILEPASDHFASTCIVRFELRAGGDLVGSWQIPIQARLWRDVLVARKALQRGQPLNDADLAKERRDALTLHEPLCQLPAEASACELASSVPAGTPLTARVVRIRPVVFRGQTAEAVVRDGVMVISLKVEVLEEGVPGQMVRVRNLQSRRELRGKVENEQTISIPL
ncbi:MAG TPA: flagellar basal body P-ring formation chaperone FlgA [Dongiaceae bacterium]|nr:flagellar basal body P-ring formation chaperone FlgA [Dongiaceae bacterium]